MENFKVQLCEKIPAQIIKLSVTDAIAPKNWPVQFVFWPLEERDLFKQCFDNLREGLSRLLVEVPAIAGNLTRSSKEDPRVLTIVVPDGAFVEFPFEDVSAMEAIPSYSDFLCSGFPLNTSLKAPLSPKQALGPMVEGSPIFCAKLNLVKGGVILSFGFSHVMADGLAVSELSSEGVAFRHLKVVTPDEEIRNYLSTPPKLDTHAELDSFLKIVSSEEAVNYLPKDAASAREAKQKATAIMMGYLAAIGEKPEPRSYAMWKFTPSKLAELKEAATGSEVDWVSTMDALAGLFWSRIAHIQRQSAKGHQKSTCVFAMSLRHRLQPPIPSAYIGNVFCPMAAECTLRELESDDTGLKSAALSMRRANTGWTQSRWDLWLKKTIALPAEQAMSINWEVTLGKHNFRFNDYSKHQLNFCDWGSPLGQVARTRCLRGAEHGGALGIWVAPRLADGGLEVFLSCNNMLRESLLEDTIFKRYAELVCQHS